jgi:serine/threonine protein kinase
MCAAAVLPFAKRGDDRANNLVRLQQLFPRIVAGQYQPPRKASDACRDLLKRMLTPDPNQRITAPEIIMHPWCGPLLQPLCSSPLVLIWISTHAALTVYTHRDLL